MKIEPIDNSVNQDMNNKIENVMGKDDFLKLLITELKHQDPLNPVDSKEFILQLSQFSSLEQLQNMNQNFGHIMKLLEIYQLNFAINLIGRKIVAMDENTQKLIEGLVKNMELNENNLYLIIDNNEKVKLKDIIKIY